MVFCNLQMAVTATAEGYGNNRTGRGQQLVAVLIINIDNRRQVWISLGPVDRINGIIFHAIGIKGRKRRNTGYLPPAFLRFHFTAQSRPGQAMDSAVIAQKLRAGKKFGTKFDPPFEIGIIFQACIRILHDPILNPDIARVREYIGVLSLSLKNLRAQRVKRRQDNKGFSRRTGTVHAEIIGGNNNNIP